MVQFGKRIKQIAEASPKYASYYLDYKSLKNALKAIDDASADHHVNPGDPPPSEDGALELADAEERFVLALEGEFAKIESFFRRIVAEMTSSFKSLCKRASVLPPLNLRESASQIISFAELQELLGDHPQHFQLVKSLLDFAEDVDELRGFVMTNAQALVKICKKHDKTSAIAIREHYIGTSIAYLLPKTFLLPVCLVFYMPCLLARCTFYDSHQHTHPNLSRRAATLHFLQFSGLWRAHCRFRGVCYPASRLAHTAQGLTFMGLRCTTSILFLAINCNCSTTGMGRGPMIDS